MKGYKIEKEWKKRIFKTDENGIEYVECETCYAYGQFPEFDPCKTCHDYCNWAHWTHCWE